MVCFAKLAELLPFPIPIPKWKGSPTSSFPWPFIGYRMVAGFTACHVNLTDDQRVNLAEPIARFLSVLHSIPKSEIRIAIFQAIIKPHQWGASDPQN